MMGGIRHFPDRYSQLSAVAYDPGSMLGWAVGTFSLRDLDSDKDESKILRHWAAGVCGGSEHSVIKEALDLAETWPNAALVTERFHLHTAVTSDEVLSPVRINAVLDYWAWCVRRPLFGQNSGDAINTFGDDRLRAAGLWSDGKDARLATAHLLLFIRRCRLPKVGKTIRDAMNWPQNSR